MNDINVTKLPLPKDMSRMESGVIQFGDDWPGIFVRGDDALYTAINLSEVTKLIEKQNSLLSVNLTNFAELLFACDIRKHK